MPDEVFKMARDVCAWEEAYRSVMYVKPETYPDKVTISHIREMLKRVEISLKSMVGLLGMHLLLKLKIIV